MATLAINTRNINGLRAGRTIKDFAEEVGVDPATMSRLVGEKAAPGPKVIAGFLDTYPYTFDHFFRVVAEESDAA